MAREKTNSKAAQGQATQERDIVWVLQEQRDSALIQCIEGVDPLENKLKSQRLTERIMHIQRERAKEKIALLSD